MVTGMLLLPRFRSQNMGSPKFAHIRELCNIEITKRTNIARLLTEKCLAPTPLKRTSVQLANVVFHESTEASLEWYADHGYPHLYQTALFIRLIREWWNCLNVKQLIAVVRLRDPSREAISGKS
uniref:Putative LOC100205425 [Hydra vulgaris] n=1 Tax=Lepeophtheirus salmonis TaxID=72036 RepID=A0A0K2U8S5_LEPSM